MRYLIAITSLNGVACAPPAAPVVAPAPPVNTAELPTVSDAAADTLLADIQRTAPEIRVGLRYATADNFTSARLPGYEGNHAYLDAYRPVRATLAMVRWTERTGRTDLLRDGYIASRSRHNLGLAIDLTLADRATGANLEMGTPFDTFSPLAHTANATGTALMNRRRLQRLMEAEGFVNYDQEWWHYSFEVPNPVRFDRVIH